MDEERSFVYTLILGVCMLLCLLMIGRMLLGHPADQIETKEPENPAQAPQTEEEEDLQMKMQLSEDDLCTMIVQALPFSPDGITAKISKDGIVSLGASVQKQSLVDSGLATGGMRTAVLFLPDPCKVYSVWNISAESGSIKLDCATMEIAGIVLPEETAAKISEQIADSLNRQLMTWGIEPKAIRFADGAISLEA